jgi:hypothetical protein
MHIPDPIPQIEPVELAEAGREQAGYLPPLSSLLSGYQIEVDHALVGASNGTTGSTGSIGTGTVHLAKGRSGTPPEDPLMVEPARAAPRPAPREVTPLHEFRQVGPPPDSAGRKTTDAGSASTLSSTPRRALAGEPKRAPKSGESPMRKLKQLRRMLDEGLITEEDYDLKKSEILSRI